ncbi:protease modulator HflC [Varunaivibrio sulfuroxidans]|uniref:Protein HflC n=1 Tax=Varunaivibrio sulfuroxidans TaxID=1773489 RepID=A0A4R3J6H2_9PROT|nr:protease modulator HflC [Varunaivibrio sulfuroxidans]TCS60977.1 protease FtsH subunit HflC [Varunaivibrio sulfuroxidans]WES31616.1 protease modulator HflC [Varunaivibrio sulfuroxidans]
MNKTVFAVLGVIVVIIGITLSSALFTVDQRDQVVVRQFGEPVRLFSKDLAVVRTPGLYFKLPFFQDVLVYDKRILDLDPQPEEVILADQKRINVDSYARYRITDPLLFLKTVRSETNFRDKFGGILNSSVRNVLGLFSLPDLLSRQRDSIMRQIDELVVKAGKSFGVEVVDVRIGRTDLPEDISKNVYERMRTERLREANKLRAEGDEAKNTIMASADLQKNIIIADANLKAQILRGEGDGKRTTILGAAYGHDLKFFELYRSLRAARTTLTDGKTNLVLSPNSDLLTFLKNLTGDIKAAK